MASERLVTRYCKHCKKVAAYGHYDYCGRSCARAAAAATQGGPGGDSGFSPAGLISKTWEFLTNVKVYYPEDSPSGVNEAMCKNCFSRPQSPPYEFCSKKCGQDYARARRAEARAASPAPSSPVSNQRFTGHSSRPSSDLLPAGFTRSPGPPVDPQYSRAPMECLFCRTVPKIPESQFCSNSCKERAHMEAPLLLEVCNWDPKYYDIANQFRTSWKKESQIPTVIRLYKIVNSKKVEEAYEGYKKAIEKQGKFSARGLAPANERRRWHGTIRKCNIGDSPENLTPCYSSECSVCSILHTSYDVKRSTVGWLGKGILTTAASSSSNEYVGCTPPGSNYRAMFLNYVVVGNAYILNQQQESIKGPPEGFDSVVANVNQSEGLAYDDLVVYKNEAIKASWLVIYNEPTGISDFILPG